VRFIAVVLVRAGKADGARRSPMPAGRNPEARHLAKLAPQVNASAAALAIFHRGHIGVKAALSS
jgi:hypothetical protein